MDVFIIIRTPNFPNRRPPVYYYTENGWSRNSCNVIKYFDEEEVKKKCKELGDCHWVDNMWWSNPEKIKKDLQSNTL